MQQCESHGCENRVDPTNRYELTVPADPCEKCKSDLYAEYCFCSRECAAAWLTRA
jgi:hypothetical protein